MRGGFRVCFSCVRCASAERELASVTRVTADNRLKELKRLFRYIGEKAQNQISSWRCWWADPSWELIRLRGRHSVSTKARTANRSASYGGSYRLTPRQWEGRVVRVLLSVYSVRPRGTRVGSIYTKVTREFTVVATAVEANICYVLHKLRKYFQNKKVLFTNKQQGNCKDSSGQRITV